MADKTLRVLGNGDPANRRPVEWTHHEVGFIVFLVLLPIFALAATVSLEWHALVFWAVWSPFLVKALGWWRRRRPQEAWLEGSVLSVRRGGTVKRCDLATVQRADLVTSMFAEPQPSFSELRVGQKKVELRYVLKTAEEEALSAGELRALAEALESGERPSEAARSAAARLREIARYGHERSWSERVDWSHRVSRRD
ncbi:hypothetical protein J4573_00180 [Actinomadura barringtoniae]|uniref:Uncharacterized protein n=1 Tax=Actinomadura barringtoniae TaxID=1427535 RepID=A0A939P5G4_9ACTN|nr:hypothetical protein [Actinomadura barringtoniae]MBO2445498.1 hypothetical protein [Actinomadura barringtoniae]